MAKKQKKRISPNPGLTPPEMLEQIRKDVSDGTENLQKLPLKSERKRKSVLSEERTRTPARPKGGGIFRTDDVPDAGRTASPDAASPLLNIDIALSEMIRTVMVEEGPEAGMSFMEAMVRQQAKKAARGDQTAVAWIADRIEGKAGQAPKRTTSLEDTEQAIDQVEVATLNRLVDPTLTDPEK